MINHFVSVLDQVFTIIVYCYCLHPPHFQKWGECVSRKSYCTDKCNKDESRHGTSYIFNMEKISAPSCRILWKHKQHDGVSLLLLCPVQHVPTSFCMWINARTHVFPKHRWSLLLQLRTSSQDQTSHRSVGECLMCVCVLFVCFHSWLHDCLHWFLIIFCAF